MTWRAARWILLIHLIQTAYAQQLVFSPQATFGKKKSAMQLWAVAGSAASQNRPPTAATVYAIAAKHGVSFIDPGVAQSRLAAKEQRSLPARIFSWGSYFETGATELVNLKVISASSQVSIGLNIAMSIVNSLLPAVQKDIPQVDPALASKLNGGSLLMDSQGMLSGLFWAEPSQVAGFIETLP